MPSKFTKLYFHLVWSTWNRAPLLAAEVEEVVHACIRAECQKLGAEVIAIGGVEDHVHLLVRAPTTASIALLMKQVKGVSSREVALRVRPGEAFKWQGGYGAFSVSAWDVERVWRYVRNQKEHHSTGALSRKLEACR